LVANSKGMAPSAKVVRSGFMLMWKDIKYNLIKRLVNQDPGPFIKLDSTFRLASRTVLVGKGRAKCLFFVLGAHNNVLTWVACNAETWEEVWGCLTSLRTRLDAHGVLHKIKGAYYDRCVRERERTRASERASEST
jgi:hypothetical protein